MQSLYKKLGLIIFLVICAGIIALPSQPTQVSFQGKNFTLPFVSPRINTVIFGTPVYKEFTLKKGLDIQGGMQVVLEADMSQIPELDRREALDSAREVILRRVDLFGIAEPNVQTSIQGQTYRLLVELPGVSDPQQALELVGTTAQLDFQLLKETQIASESADVTESTVPQTVLEPTGLTGKQLKKTSVQFDPQTGEPTVALAFNEEGTKLFADITQNNLGAPLGIFIDQSIVMAPVIQVPILTGEAVISGGFTVDTAKQLSIQLNAGALPVPITVLEQRTIGASLGEQSVLLSVRAGVIGLLAVCIFMIAFYGIKGIFSAITLLMYAVFTAAVYKLVGITLTLPGIAGLLLSIGMAVDANILVYERMKEELRSGKDPDRALELGFGRAWDSIKDANIATIVTSLILINPLNLAFLNTSGLVRGFGVTLLFGVLISLFTGVFVSRVLLRLFYKPKAIRNS